MTHDELALRLGQLAGSLLPNDERREWLARSMAQGGPLMGYVESLRDLLNEVIQEAKAISAPKAVEPPKADAEFVIVIQPTPELYRAPIDGVHVPVRVWVGESRGGVPIEAYVLSIVPNSDSDEDHSKLLAELPGFMVPSSSMYLIDTSPLPKAQPPKDH